jgi:hypothetical protein
MDEKLYTRKGVKTVHYVERGKPKENITCTYVFGADGSYIEPMITFKQAISTVADIAYAAGSKF